MGLELHTKDNMYHELELENTFNFKLLSSDAEIIIYSLHLLREHILELQSDDEYYFILSVISKIQINLQNKLQQTEN